MKKCEMLTRASGSGLAFVCLIVAAVRCTVAGALPRDPIETWDPAGDLKGWGEIAYYADATLANGDGTAQMAFDVGVFTPQYGSVSASGAGASSRFIGDYYGVGVTAVTFRVRSKSGLLPTWGRLAIETKNRTWYTVRNAVVFSSVAGEWTANAVSLSPEKWWAEGADSATSFLPDLQSVTSIRMEVKRAGDSGQEYSLDDLRLRRAMLTRTWTQANFPGRELTDALAMEDNDNDGENNWAEFLAGTDPNKASSVFVLQLATVRGPNGEIVLSWKSEPNRLYTVKRTGDLMAVFSTPPGTTQSPVDIPSASGGENKWTDDSAAVKGSAGPWFYKVEVKEAVTQ